MFQIFAEAPNYVKLSFTANDATTVTVRALLGTKDAPITWQVPTRTLMPGAPTLYTLVYDKAATPPTLSFNVGVTAAAADKQPLDTSVTDITLGTSTVRINNRGNLDANMFAFAYFAAPLSAADLTALNEYFTQQKNGYDVLIQSRRALRNANQQLTDDVRSMEGRLASCQSDLAACETSSLAARSSAAAANAPKMWQIRSDGTELGAAAAADSAQCSPLTINTFGKSSSVGSSSASASALVTEYPASSAQRFKVAYPSNDVGAAVAKPIPAAAGAGASTSTAVVTSASSSNVSTATLSSSSSSSNVIAPSTNFWGTVLDWANGQAST